MADLAASAVTIDHHWLYGGAEGKRLFEINFHAVLTGQGTTTNKITAAALGMTKIVKTTNLVKSDDTVIYPAVVAHDGSCVLLMDVTNATDGTRAAPADITATVYGTVTGQ